MNASGGDRTVDLAAITQAASREAGGVPAGLLGGYLPAVLDAASSGRRLSAAELAEYARSGEQAAEGGVALRGLVDLYLSATWPRRATPPSAACSPDRAYSASSAADRRRPLLAASRTAGR